jgi:hypothetical protein
MSDRRLVPAVGGQRLVPAPDPVARDYLLLGLRLDQHIPGLVDGYFGPADLKAQVDLEQLRPPAGLVADAGDLLGRLDDEVDDPARRAWLRVQLVALETLAGSLAGTRLPYLEVVARSFDARPVRRGDAYFAALAGQLDAVVPGTGDLRDRLAAWDDGVVIPIDRLSGIVDWLVAEFRARAGDRFGLPEGEGLRVGLVRDQPWTGYNWYDGGLRSRVDLNLDLPIRAPDLVSIVAHETYPGHHLEHAWHETIRVVERGQLEASLLLIDTPECFISEGLAEVGRRFAVPVDTELDLFEELFARAGLRPQSGLPDLRSTADLAIRIRAARAGFGAAAVDAALQLNVDGRSPAEVGGWLETVGLMTPERAAKLLAFLEHPLWRTYVFVYTEGAELLDRWLDAPASGADDVARFKRLLTEPLTPSAIAAELAAAIPPGDAAS